MKILAFGDTHNNNTYIEKLILKSRKHNVDFVVCNGDFADWGVNTKEILESFKMKKVVMHCFSGKKPLVKRIVDNGWFLTVPTIVVRSFQFQDIAKHVPINQLFCETDSPYLGPYKEQWNEPAYVAESYNKIAELKQMDIKEVINSIYVNWQKVFE